MSEQNIIILVVVVIGAVYTFIIHQVITHTEKIKRQMLCDALAQRVETFVNEVLDTATSITVKKLATEFARDHIDIIISNQQL